MRSKAWIARNNVAMFREKLDAETDALKKIVLAELLAKEIEKLRRLDES